MIQAQRFCQVEGHYHNMCSQICTFQDCNQSSRWVCVECVIQQTHQHNLASNIHLMNQQQFRVLINQMFARDFRNYNQIQKEIKEQILQISKMIQEINQLLFLLQNFQQEIDDNKIPVQISQLVDNEFYSLNNSQIKQILNKQNTKLIKFNHQIVLDRVKQITKLSQEIEQSLLKSQQTIQQTQTNNSYNFKDYIKFQQNNYINTAQISQNEQYLVYGGKECLLIIYDLYLDKQIKSIKLDQEIIVCRFTDDRSSLYVGCYNGYVYCADIVNDFKKTYKQQLSKYAICNITELSSKIIITSDEKDIIITNISLCQQILKIENAHNDSIHGLDYDKFNNTIVSGSSDNNIKFFNAFSGQLLIQKKQAHHDDLILKLQLINNDKLLSASYESLKYWQVDNKNNNIILLRQIEDQHDIYNFDCFNQQNIIIIYEQYFKLLDNDFQLIKKIEHSQKDIQYTITNQLQTINYIIISGYNQFILMKRVQLEKE